MKKIAYTKEGFEELLKQKEHLEMQRITAVKDLSVARDMGDRSENAAYKSARQKLSGIDRQLRFINSQLRYAEVIQPRTDGIVGIGSKVVVEDSKGEKEITIVGGYESNLSRGWISQYSPLGKALLFKKAGDKAIFTAPAGIIEYFIKSVI